jgi:hypothetical protein
MSVRPQITRTRKNVVGPYLRTLRIGLLSAKYEVRKKRRPINNENREKICRESIGLLLVPNLEIRNWKTKTLSMIISAETNTIK